MTNNIYRACAESEDRKEKCLQRIALEKVIRYKKAHLDYLESLLVESQTISGPLSLAVDFGHIDRKIRLVIKEDSCLQRYDKELDKLASNPQEYSNVKGWVFNEVRLKEDEKNRKAGFFITLGEE